MAGYALPHNMQHKAASTATTLRLLKRLASNRVLEGRLKISSKQKPLLTRYNDGDIIHVEDGGQPGAGIKGPYSILAFWNSTTATMDENVIAAMARWPDVPDVFGWLSLTERGQRSEEHTSELQSLMRISYAVFCLKKKKPRLHTTKTE